MRVLFCFLLLTVQAGGQIATADYFFNPLEGGWSDICASVWGVNPQDASVNCITQGFGEAGDNTLYPFNQHPSGWGSYQGYHLGYDVKVQYPTPTGRLKAVFAPANGIVVFADVVVGYTVVIQHLLPAGDPDGSVVYSVFFHLLPPAGLRNGDPRGVSLQPNSAVGIGDLIGYVSPNPVDYGCAKGQSFADCGTRPHQHYGIRKSTNLPADILKNPGEHDSRTNFWYFVGYSSISPDFPGKTNPTHRQIISEWFNPYEFLLRHAGPPATITEYVVPTDNSGPTGITLGPDGALWFTENLGNKIGRINAAGVITEYTVPTPNGHPWGIVMGPDGALWFTEWGDSRTAFYQPAKIGRITTSGSITEYNTPTPNSIPYHITLGPDGALWFTEGGANQIGRVTTSGVFNEYPLPTGHGYPYGITTGPDRALWFTEVSSGRIGRITTSGLIKEFPIANSIPYGITTGPDHALWFMDGTFQIRSITTTGVVAAYSTCAGFEITAPRVGPLWFVTGPAGCNTIGRITGTGRVLEYSLPTPNSVPWGIVMGPDGALWFTESQGNKIGRAGDPIPIL